MTERKLLRGTEDTEEFYCVRCAHLDGNRSLFSLWKLFNSPARPRLPYVKDDSL